MKTREFFKELTSHKSAVAGMAILLSLTAISIYGALSMPLDEASRLWRAGERKWLDNPRNAMPSWLNLFLMNKLPETKIIDSRDGGLAALKTVVELGRETIVLIDMVFDYQYDEFPSEINLFLSARYNSTPPFLTIKWGKPDGEELTIKKFVMSSRTESYYISIDRELSEELSRLLAERTGRLLVDELPVEVALFVSERELREGGVFKPLKGRYNLSIEATFREGGSDLEAKLVVYGKVYGIAGTDHLRRDISIALLWGMPIAMVFGTAAAVAVTMLQLLIAAISAWYRGLIDSIVQILTEVFIVLPLLPLLIMISVFYDLKIWDLLLIIIALNALGPAVKVYRAAFLQVREMPYIEAARAYGCSGKRIVIMYLIPKVLPTAIPQLVTSIASFVFLEAVLAFLGIGDPDLPTLGKVIGDAWVQGALYKGQYYWVLQPSALLVLTAMGFALLGFALDETFNPRLRT